MMRALLTKVTHQGEEILVTGAEEKKQQVVRGGGKGAYIKQQNSKTLEERNVREKCKRKVRGILELPGTS